MEEIIWPDSRYILKVETSNFPGGLETHSGCDLKERKETTVSVIFEGWSLMQLTKYLWLSLNEQIIFPFLSILEEYTP